MAVEKDRELWGAKETAVGYRADRGELENRNRELDRGGERQKQQLWVISADPDLCLQPLQGPSVTRLIAGWQGEQWLPSIVCSQGDSEQESV